MIKRALRIVLRTLLVFVAFVALYALAALVLSRIPVAGEAQADASVDIYILSNGVHTDIVVPVANTVHDWRGDVPYTNTTGRDSRAHWLAMGWGDKGFYLETPTWGDLTARVACRAAFGLGRSAMHATFHRSLAEGAQCKRITMDIVHYQHLCAFLAAGFERDAAGRTAVIHTHANYGSTDAFYEGIGRYSLLHTCNTWANNALKAGGLKACAWTPFDTGIFRQYR